MDNLTIFENADDALVAAHVVLTLQRALSTSEGPVAMTVPGGSTPFPIFELLAKQPIDWSRIVVWPGDDRIVPEDHPASNTGKIRALFEPLGAEVVTLTIMEQVPHFTLAWLGMGADGHVASLFPNTDPQVDEPAPILRLTPNPLPPEAPFDRKTLTLPSLLNSNEIMFVIRGEEKLAVFKQAAGGAHDLPVARLLSAASQRVSCFA